MNSPDTIDVTAISRPFFWIKAANILIISTGAAFPFIMLAGLLKGQMNLVAAAIFLPLTAGFCFAACIAWKNVTVLNAVIQRWTVTSLFTFTVCAFLLAFAAGVASLADDLSAAQIASFDSVAWSAIFLGGITLVSAVSVLRLRRRMLDTFGMKLSDFLRTLNAGSAKSGKRALPPRNRARGWWLILGASTVMLGFNLIPGPEGTSLAPFGSLAFLFLLYARSQFQPSAAGLLESDPRSPVLFLRSFKDEERVNYARADFGFVDFSLEARVAAHFYSWGPFIAVDAPRHKNIAIGAARGSFTDADWQTAVMAWMDAASTIVLLAGTTRWIEWELRTVIERGHTGKLIVCFPQSRARWFARDRRLRTRRGSATARLEVMRAAFAGSPWEPRLRESINPLRIRSMVFGPDGRVTMVVARSRNRNTNHLAILIGHYLLLQGGLIDEAPSTVQSGSRLPDGHLAS